MTDNHCITVINMINYFRTQVTWPEAINLSIDSGCYYLSNESENVCESKEIKMRHSTVVHARMESKGRPDVTRDHIGTTQKLVLEFAQWILEVPMGSHIVLTIARTQEDLDIKTGRVKPKEKQANAFDDMLGDLGRLGFVPDEDEEAPELAFKANISE